MSQEKPIHLSIEVKSSDGTPIQIASLKINNKEFVSLEQSINQNSDKTSDSILSDPVIVASTTLASSSHRDPKIDEEKEDVATSKANIDPTDDCNTLEEFGGNSFYRSFWGKLNYKPLDNKTSLVTYIGNEDVFDQEFIGKWLEPSRIHKCSHEFPQKGRNYFPSAIAVVYSRVLEVRDGKNLIVDFLYNGGSIESPIESTNQDGTFFFDNKFSIEAWGSSLNRKSNLVAKSGQVYGCLGFPKISIGPDSTLNFRWTGEGDRPAIHLMLSDAFTGDEHGRGEAMPESFKETFGENLRIFDLPGKGRVEIDFNWQLLPPTYSQKVVQYGVPTGVVFYDGASLSSQFGLKRFSNFDQFRIRNQMNKALGFTRVGVTCSMPNQGYCNGGGIHDGSDVTEFCTYRFEGDWFARDPNNMKARTSGGLRLEWIGKSPESPGRFVELESQKAFEFKNLRLRFLSNSEVEVDSPEFTWYHLACQEWTGGTSTGSEFTYIEIQGKRIGLNSNGDFWLTNGENDLEGRSFRSRTVKIFDKIPTRGDLIRQDLRNLKECGLIGKISETRFEVWGWAIQSGDQFSYGGEIFTVKSAERKWKTWEQFAVQNSLTDDRFKRGDRRITYTELTLDKPVTDSLVLIQFKVEKSQLQELLDGNFRESCKAGWGIGDEAPGHLMYIDYNVNLILKNVEIHGMIRSTSRPLWSETTRPHSGFIDSISVNALGSQIWKKGDKLWLVHPESSKMQQVELLENFNGNRGDVKILPLTLSQEFPQDSVLVGLFSLASESRFEQVKFIKEDLSPCYSERIDYRPQGLRLRQLLTNDSSKRVQIIGGRICWYSNLDNRFEPEVEFSQRPLLVNTKSVVPMILNPIVGDKNGIIFGYQTKEVGKEEFFIAYRIVVSSGKSIDLSKSVLGADLYLEGNGELILDQLSSKNYIDNNRDSGVGFNLVVQDKFRKSESLVLKGKGGRVGLMVNSPYPIGDLKIDFQNWELRPGLFNGAGFQSAQNQNDPKYSEFIRISK